MRAVRLLLILVLAPACWADAIPLYDETPRTADWDGPSRAYYSEIFRTDVVTNVSVPVLTPFLPEPADATGTAVVLAPGGGFHALSINSEGNDVARWLNERGIAAFVLQYRLVPSGDDGVAEMVAKSEEQAAADMAGIAPLAGADGLAAMRVVRARAEAFNVDPERIGFMGFSAGGAVTLHVAFNYDEDTRPAFVAPIYAANRWLADADLPDDPPAAFIVAATDDQLGLAPDSVALYQRWLQAEASAELHIYAHGGHGFGMRTQNLPSDRWIDRFGEWLADWQARQENTGGQE